MRDTEPDIAAMYHLNSSQARERVPPEPPLHDGMPQRFRTYPGAARIDLPGGDADLEGRLGDLLSRRRSVREYRREPIPLETLGSLLRASYGVRGYREIEGQWVQDRAVPSAGALYPLELYVATALVERLGDGIYHYDARAHALELLDSGDHRDALALMTVGQRMVQQAGVVIIITALFERTMWKYGQRGYRYVLLDAGHLAQTIYLCAASLGLAASAIGGFFDAELNEYLHLPQGEESLYLLSLGLPIG